jgi:hypothetical protein
MGKLWKCGGAAALAKAFSANEITFEQLAGELTSDRWTLSAGGLGKLVARLQERMPKFVDTQPHLFQGLKTSADKIYMVRGDARGTDEITVTNLLDEKFQVESAILRPVVKGEDVQRYSITREQRLWIIYPYAINSGVASLVPANLWKETYPLAWKYLSKHRDVLGARDRGAWASRDDWYAYAREQNIAAFEGTKLLVPYMTTRLRASLDLSDTLFFVNITTGGYGLRADLGRHDPRYLLGIINSTLWNACISQMTNAFRGGYFAVNKQAIERLPWRAIDFDRGSDVELHNHLVASAETMLSLNKRLTAEPHPQRREQLQREIDATDRQIDQLVYQLYDLSEDEIRIVQEATK